MTTIPTVFQFAVASYELAEREREYWEREEQKKLAGKLARELKALGLEVPSIVIPTVTIEGIEFMLTGNKTDGYDVSARLYTYEDGLVWLNIYDLERLGKVIQEHYQVLAAMEERKVKP